jgi:hypothetical protein
MSHQIRVYAVMGAGRVFLHVCPAFSDFSAGLLQISACVHGANSSADIFARGTTSYSKRS